MHCTAHTGPGWSSSAEAERLRQGCQFGMPGSQLLCRDECARPDTDDQSEVWLLVDDKGHKSVVGTASENAQVIRLTKLLRMHIALLPLRQFRQVYHGGYMSVLLYQTVYPTCSPCEVAETETYRQHQHCRHALESQSGLHVQCCCLSILSLLQVSRCEQ